MERKRGKTGGAVCGGAMIFMKKIKQQNRKMQNRKTAKGAKCEILKRQEFYILRFRGFAFCCFASFVFLVLLPSSFKTIFSPKIFTGL
jgi:hypothetical protein